VYQLANIQLLDADGTPLDEHGGKAPQPVGYTIAAGLPAGAVAVQVETDGTVTVEVFPQTLASTVTGFGATKRHYHR
jgi:hypothetical protein